MLTLFSDKEGVLALSYMIRYAKQLSTLTINDNPLPSASWKLLRDTLASSTTLTSLSALRCNVPIEELPVLPHQTPASPS
jgi:hypothetical protein